MGRIAPVSGAKRCMPTAAAKRQPIARPRRCRVGTIAAKNFSRPPANSGWCLCHYAQTSGFGGEPLGENRPFNPRVLLRTLNLAKTPPIGYPSGCLSCGECSEPCPGGTSGKCSVCDPLDRSLIHGASRRIGRDEVLLATLASMIAKKWLGPAPWAFGVAIHPGGVR